MKLIVAGAVIAYILKLAFIAAVVYVILNPTLIGEFAGGVSNGYNQTINTTTLP